MFTLAQIECFIAVAEELHFGAAATRLRMTQPPLSRQIQQLERELGAVLFERTSRRVALTAAGRALLPNARRLLDLSLRTSADVRAVAAGEAGSLTIAYTAMAGQSVIPELLRRASHEMPRVTLMLREMVTLDQIEEIERGTVDVGFMRPVLDRGAVRTRVVHEERLVLAAPEGSRLAQGQHPVRLADLDDEPLLMYSPGVARYFHDLLVTMFVGAGVQPRIVQYAGQVPALLALVSADLGVALVPESAGAIAPPGVALRRLGEGERPDPLQPVRLHVGWSEQRRTPLTDALLRLAGELNRAVF
ncbi:LysR family transcriptional regulator [Microbacterium oryzae]|uniref:LysR family transcriptional regulator n=1 Tax=Microbacterium oryzae TaxID=743009 RepID=UPI0025AF8948|nr:LysR family transcriptional regulator [Microbacterium oryzae]MDN3311390.1 LysR family transcriptional regulator [Microbacterium oryzae]